MSAQNPTASIPARHPAGGSARETILAAALLAAVVAVFAMSGLRAGAAPAEVVIASFCFGWLFIPCVVLGTPSGHSALRAWLRPAPGSRGAFLLILPLGGFAAYAGVASRLGPRAMALPLHGAGVLTVFELAVLVLTLVKPVTRIGYTFALTRRDLLVAGAGFATFAAIAVPLGIALGFLHLGWARLDALAWSQRVFSLTFLVSLPEELVFRGALQNALERRVFPRRPWLALAIAALIFGASHMGHPPVPNWRYGILATLAGVAYGWVWHRTGKITAAALVHAAVVLVWALALRGS